MGFDRERDKDPAYLLGEFDVYRMVRMEGLQRHANVIRRTAFDMQHRFPTFDRNVAYVSSYFDMRKDAEIRLSPGYLWVGRNGAVAMRGAWLETDKVTGKPVMQNWAPPSTLFNAASLAKPSALREIARATDFFPYQHSVKSTAIHEHFHHVSMEWHLSDALLGTDLTQQVAEFRQKHFPHIHGPSKFDIRSQLSGLALRTKGLRDYAGVNPEEFFAEIGTSYLLNGPRMQTKAVQEFGRMLEENSKPEVLKKRQSALIEASIDDWRTGDWWHDAPSVLKPSRDSDYRFRSLVDVMGKNYRWAVGLEAAIDLADRVKTSPALVDTTHGKGAALDYVVNNRFDGLGPDLSL